MTPKDRFLSTAHAKHHADLVHSDGFLAACEYAMLELVNQMPMAGDPQKHWDSYSQLVGAKKFVAILKTVADVTPPPAKTVTNVLDYNLKK